MLTAERVRELLSYDPSSGEFRWKIRIGRRVKAGSLAGWEAEDGHKVSKYWRIRIFGTAYKAHRLAWLVTYGEFPQEQIDHIDGNGLNNRLENLRAATNADNSKNRRRQGNNTSGVCGVFWHKASKRWRATIGVNKDKRWLGSFRSKDEAIAARKAAERKYGFHENHGSGRVLTGNAQ